MAPSTTPRECACNGSTGRMVSAAGKGTYEPDEQMPLPAAKLFCRRPFLNRKFAIYISVVVYVAAAPANSRSAWCRASCAASPTDHGQVGRGSVGSSQGHTRLLGSVGTDQSQ